MRGQSSIEFIILVMVTFVLFLSFVYLYGTKIETTTNTQLRDKIMDVCNVISDELYTASIVKDGYRRTFALPKNIYGMDYNITEHKTDEYVVVDVVCRNTTYSITVPYYEGSLSKGENVVQKEHGGITIS